MDHKRRRAYKFKYVNPKLSYPKIKGGHYLEVPQDFFSEATYQHTGYYHPHDLGLYYLNDFFGNNFINNYFIPNYINYANKKLGTEEKTEILKILMSDVRFVNLGITYQRLKSILMYLDDDPLLVKNFHHYMTTVTIPVMPLRVVGQENIDKIIALNVENYPIEIEQLRITVQLLIIHIVNYAAKHKKMPDWLNQSPIKEFVELNNLYVQTYEIKGLPTILKFEYTPGIYNAQNLSFIRTFGKSLPILNEMFKINTILSESNVVLNLEK